MMSATEIGHAEVDRLRAWIGREDVASDIISSDLVRKFNATFDLDAEPTIHGSVAPLFVHYCLAAPAALTSTLGDDGHPRRGGFLPPIPLPRRMWAGSSVLFHRDLLVGEEIQRFSRISNVAFKNGRTGSLCFVAVDHQITAGGKLAIEERQDIVYREAATTAGTAVVAAEIAPMGAHVRPMINSTPLLFRYSALTFNGHRIHYDRRYATDVEHYRGLVVHGPLQATLLLYFASELKGRSPTRFAFKAQSPVFDDDRISLHAAEDGSALKLWTCSEGGPIAVSAEAEWF